MKRSNLITSMTCKYPSILTGLIFTATTILPLATAANGQSANPVLAIDTNISLTGPLPVGSPALYRVTIKNTSTVPAYNVKITDTLPTGFKYDKEVTILTKGAVAPSSSTGYIKPSTTNNTNTLVWDNYNIPAGGIVTLIFTANTSSAALGTFSNAVTVNYKNSAGTAQTAVTNSGSGTTDDVTIKAVPPLPTLANITQSTGAQSFTPELLCGGKPGADGLAENITGIINTYFQPALASVAAGTKNINIIGDGQGANKDIKPGDLLLIVQMQDASINTANGPAYGSGDATYQGSGHTSMGKTGLYEYAIANSTVTYASGNRTLTLKNPLINSYVSSAVGSTSGQKRFQVVRVPQHTSIKVNGTLYASPWDGNVGGILAVDTFGTFDFNGQRISANSVGFRGGFGFQNGGLGAIDTHVAMTSVYTTDANGKVNLTLDSNGNPTGAPVSTTTARTAGSGKGEGTAGTPRFISTQTLKNVDPLNGSPNWSGGSFDNIVEGYPGGDTGRGAPANAGGAGNYHNAGGGGGGNGGIGGQGGLSWSGGTAYVSKDTGGRPGFLSSTNNPVPWQLIMGGGGGGGDANNSPQGVPGGAGGGMIMLRAGTIVGTGSIYANGREGNRGSYLGAPDGAGGGGAGGTVLIHSRNATSANITIQAKGGNGGSTERDAFYDYRTAPVTVANQNSGETVGYTADGYKYSHTPHGPGGGGGGGVILYNAPGATIDASAAGGTEGHTDDNVADPSTSATLPAQAQENARIAAASGKAQNPHGAVAGANGIVVPFTNSEDPFNLLNNVTNCSPNLTMTSITSTPTVIAGKFATYKMTVTNTAAIGSATQVSLQNRLPAGFAYAATNSIVLTRGSATSTQSNASSPTANSQTPVWGTFTIPPGGVVEIEFKALVRSDASNGVYASNADAIYPDPEATTADATITRTQQVNVTVKALVEMVWKFSPKVLNARK
jgi:uncharacterized repeat protein (TIGR01451 family)